MSTPNLLTYHGLFPPSRHQIACRDEALTEEFSAGLKLIVQNGVLQEIIERYPD